MSNAADAIIDLIAEAMSRMSTDLTASPSTSEAHTHLGDARRLLIAKYQPSVYPHGMD